MGAETLTKMLRVTKGEDAPSLSQAGPCLNVAVGKTSRHLYDVPAQVDDFQQGEFSPKTLLETAPSPGLLVVVSISGNSPGLMCLDSLLVNALVELSTGASARTVFLESRTPTRIDTALCQGFCTHLLAALPKELAHVAGVPVPPALGWDSTETEAEKLAFLLEGARYSQISGRIDFQHGLRGGVFSLALPNEAWTQTAARPASRGASRDGQDNGWTRQLRANVLSAPIRLRADIETLQFSLEQALNLKAGDFLEIAPSALSSLELTTPDGLGLLNGRLGQQNGKKAILVTGSADAARVGAQPAKPDEPDFAAATAEFAGDLVLQPASGADTDTAIENPVPASDIPA